MNKTAAYRPKTHLSNHTINLLKCPKMNWHLITKLIY